MEKISLLDLTIELFLLSFRSLWKIETFIARNQKLLCIDEHRRQQTLVRTLVLYNAA